jgi:hypothetical protein
MLTFHAEDVEVAAHAALPPLQRDFEASDAEGSAPEALRAALEMKLSRDVRAAQRQGWVPAPEALAALPAFARAAELDAAAVQAMQADAARMEADAARAAEEARRAEEERARRAREARDAERARRAEDKELRRQEKVVERREARAQARAEGQRRFQELHARWEAAVAERRAAVEGAQGGVTAAAAAAERLELHLAELAARKGALLKQLRDLVSAHRLSIRSFLRLLASRVACCRLACTAAARFVGVPLLTAVCT